MKIVEVVAEAGYVDTLAGVAEQQGVTDYWLGPVGEDGRQSVRMLVPPEVRQAVLDGLQGALGGAEKARIVVIPVEASLQRLGTDRIDLYQTHWQESTTPIADAMGELLRLRDEGKIRAIGVSNVTVAQLEEYRAAGELASDQEQYSMLFRKHEDALLPYCRENGLAFLAYSPLAQGLLTGKVGPDRVFPEGDQRASKPRFSVENRAKIAAMLDKFKPIAEGRGLTLAQLAIAWTVAQEGCTHALCGARTPQQAIENAAAGDVELEESELAAMAEAVAQRGGDIE